MTNDVEDVKVEDDAIDELFENEPEDAEAEEESKEEAKPDDAEGSAGEEDTEGKTEEDSDKESGPPTDEKPKLVPIAALHDERRKAQELKKENEALKSKIPQDDQKPDMYDDPEAYELWVERKAEQKVANAQSAEFAERVEISRGKMLEAHEDYQEAESVFYVLASQDETLKREMFASPDPAQFAYEEGKAYMKGLEDAAEVRFLARNKDPDEPSKEPEDTKIAKVPSLAKATAQASNSTPVEKDEDLDDMFEDQVY